MADRTKYNQALEELKQQLIVPIEVLQASSSFDLNIEEGKLIYACIEAQNLYLEPIIGSALLRKLQENNLTFEYQILLDKFANKAILHWGAAEAIQGLAFQIANGGIYKHVASDSETASSKDISNIRQSHLNKADTYAGRMVEFLNKNEEYYPEYEQSVADGIDATQEAKYTGGLLIETRGSYRVNKVGNSKPALFVATVWHGNSNAVGMGFDPSTLENSENKVPPYITAQPINDYFWIVSDVKIDIYQAGTKIPTVDFSDINSAGAIFVHGEQDDLHWIRVKLLNTYESPVTFQTQI